MSRHFFIALTGLALLTAPLQSETADHRDRPTVALVLSGGGARGGAHIGVLKKFEEAGVPIDMISGASFGALVGGLYSVGYSAADIELIVKSIDWNQMLDETPDRRLLNFDNKRRADRRLFELKFEQFDLKLPTGLQPGQKISQLLDRLTALPVLEADNDFDRLPVAFRAVATDILSGLPYVFKDGSMSKAIRASIAVPGLFTPVELGEALLMDGGLADNLPVDPALEAGADLVIAVDVSTPLKSSKDRIGSVVDILDQVISIHIEENKQESLQKAHVVVFPELEQFSSSDFAHVSQVIEIGYRAADEVLPTLRQLFVENSVGLGSGSARRPFLDAENFNLETFQWSDREIVPAGVKTEGLNRFESAARETGQAGAAVSLNGIDRRVSALYGTDLFEEVGFRLQRDRGRTLLTYEFQESPPTTVGVGLRYDRDYNFTASLDLIARDFRRSGSDLTFRGLAGDARAAQLGWNYPTISANRLFFSPRVYFRSYPRFVFDGDEVAGEFSDERTGFDLGFRLLLGNRGRLEGGYQLDRVNIARGLGAFSQAEAEKVGLLRAGLRWDTLDDLGFPTTGWRGRFLVERADSALGGDSDFTRFSAKGDRYFKAGAKDVVGVRGFWGLIRGEAPFYERFYAGGVHYLSFSAEPFIGLRRDERVADHLLTAGFSYRREVKKFQLGFLQAVYLEAEYQAGVFNRGRELLDFQSALHGFGGGVHLDTRFFGPIRLTLGGTDQGDFNAYVSFGRFF